MDKLGQMTFDFLRIILIFRRRNAHKFETAFHAILVPMKGVCFSIEGNFRSNTYLSDLQLKTASTIIWGYEGINIQIFLCFLVSSGQTL